jgi:hypothetical protein
MSVIYAPDSAYAKEMVKHEAQYSPFGPGERPYEFRPYPMMLHKAGRPAGGMGPDEIIETKIVESDDAEALARGQGFRPTPLQALEAFTKDQFDIAELAANGAFHERRMSPNAQAEAYAAREEAGVHIAEIPALPIKRRRAKGKGL